MKSKWVRLFGVSLASLYFLHYALTYKEWHFIDNVNLIFHEAGHTLFMFFGDFIHSLMGSGFQILLPLVIAGYFFYTNQRIAAAICLMWTGQNFLNVSMYAGDAVTMQLPLLGGDSSMHDWHYLLGTLGWLNYTPIIAGIVYSLGLVTIFIAIIFAFYSASTKTGW